MAEWRRIVSERIAGARLDPMREAEIVDEITQHVEDRYRDAIARGVTEADAEREALSEIDARERLVKDLARLPTPAPMLPIGAPRSGRWLSGLVQDLKYAIRSLRRAPAFALTVVAILALTIGPTTAILSIGDWLFWRSPPGVAQPDRLAVVLFGEWRGTGSVSPRALSEPNRIDLQRASTTMAGLAGWQESTVSLAADGVPPRQAGSAHAAANFFDLLGVRPAAGRFFTAEEDRPPFGSPVAVIGDRLAQGLFGNREAALGKSILVNGRPLQVIGVLPPGFVGASPFSDVDVWFPSSTYYDIRHFEARYLKNRGTRGGGGAFYTFVARLQPGSSFEAMKSELDLLVPALAEQYPSDNEEFKTARARVFPGLGPNELQRAQFRTLVGNLLLVGAALLLLGCANVANLLLSRGVRLQHDRAVRMALGASRRRLIQQVLTESCVLSLVGAALGVGLAIGLKELIRTLLLPGTAGVANLEVPLDARVLAATLIVSTGCGLLAGLVPAWMGSTGRPARALGRDDRRTSTGRSRLRTGLAVAQLALSLALVTNATLLVTTLRNLSAVEVGFDSRQVTIHYLDLGSHGYAADRALVFDRELVSRLADDPVVRTASLSTGHPPYCGFGSNLVDPSAAGKTFEVCENFVTEDYFQTVGVPIVRGRGFTRAETLTTATPVGSPVILSETLARRLFGEADPIGRRVAVPATRSQPSHDRLVVGIARDVRSPLAAKPETFLYTPFAMGESYSAMRPVLLVRSDRPVRDVAERVKAHTAAIDPSLALGPPLTLEGSLARMLANRRVFAWVLTLLGGLGFVLAAVGLYGLLAQIVSERTREFGIRMAIGADRRHVVSLVARLALWVAVLGGAAGLGLAAFGSQLVETQLVGVGRFDLGVYAVSAALLVAVILAACLIPAQRASKVNPVEVLRSE